MIISIETTRTPYVSEEDHLVVDHLGYEDDGISHLTAKVGFQEAIKVPAPLRPRLHPRPRGRRPRGGRRLLPLPGDDPARPTGPAAWRAGASSLYVALARNSVSPADYFHLPADRTVTIGSAIDL